MNNNEKMREECGQKTQEIVSNMETEKDKIQNNSMISLQDQLIENEFNILETSIFHKLNEMHS